MDHFIDNRKIILFLMLFFVLVIGSIGFLNLTKKNFQSTSLSISPTFSYKNTETFPLNKRSTTNIPSQINTDKDEKNEFQKEIVTKAKIFSKEEIKKVNQFLKKIPIDDENYSIDYSPLFNKFYFIPKNNQGKLEIERLIKENQLDELIKKYPEIFILNENIKEEVVERERENYLKNMDVEKLDSQIPSFPQTAYPNNEQVTVTPTLSDELNPFSSLVEILRIFYGMGNVDYSQTITPSLTSFLSPSTSYPIPSLFNPPSFNHSNFTQLFNEVGSKVGVPPKILAAVMTIETPSTFNLSPEEINLYSTPNNVMPRCGPNVCSATGPMQMTIGIDNKGSSQCLGCGLTSCPNAWARYGDAINIFTGASHNPNPCNLLDNIYAAAYKLKTDSGATDPVNWTQEQVYRAGTRYYGSCSDRYRYSRLGNRTYCEFLWWFYNSK